MGLGLHDGIDLIDIAAFSAISGSSVASDDDEYRKESAKAEQTKLTKELGGSGNTRNLFFQNREQFVTILKAASKRFGAFNSTKWSKDEEENDYFDERFLAFFKKPASDPDDEEEYTFYDVYEEEEDNTYVVFKNVVVEEFPNLIVMSITLDPTSYEYTRNISLLYAITDAVTALKKK